MKYQPILEIIDSADRSANTRKVPSRKKSDLNSSEQSIDLLELRKRSHKPEVSVLVLRVAASLTSAAVSLLPLHHMSVAVTPIPGKEDRFSQEM